ncbi:MAG: GGDEF domain-containing protein, partial [Gammaproteobacteria bacterium]|nr:GGDEF domain-containing protein [Gammaproteobacteria bacterium]
MRNREPMVSATSVDPAGPERCRSATVLDSATVRSLHLFSLAVGGAAAAMGGLVLVGGWGLDIASLKRVLPGLSTMKVNTALGIAALGGGLALIDRGRSSRIAAGAMAGLALAIGVLTLAEYALDWNAGIDEFLFRDPATPLAACPGRPAAATALMVTLLAAAQLFARRPALHVAKTTGALATALIAWSSLSGYVFGSQALREVPPFSTVAVLTATAMLLIGIGTFAVHPVSWPLRTALAKGTGGTVCRWLLPPAILATPLLGWFLSRASAVHSYPDAFRWALYSVASSLGSVSLILLLAHRIALIDEERTFATEMSLHDPLTGLANRRAFDSFLFESFG